MTNLDKKLRIYNLLKNGSCCAFLMRSGFNVYENPIKCNVYFNRQIDNITEDNHQSFKNITIKFNIPKENIDKDYIYPEFNQIDFVSIEDGGIGQSHGVILHYDLRQMEYIQKCDDIFSVKITFNEDESYSIIREYGE